MLQAVLIDPLALDDDINVWVRRLCGHHNVVRILMDGELEPQQALIRRAEVALCPPCYAVWQSNSLAEGGSATRVAV